MKEQPTKVGIVVDDYKLQMFLVKLKELNFSATWKPFGDKLTIIHIEVTKDKVLDVARVVRSVTNHFEKRPLRNGQSDFSAN